jgi:hypothetical protein
MGIGILSLFVKNVEQRDFQLGKKGMLGMELIKTIDFIRHEQIRPMQQSLKAHIELAHNSTLHISPQVLKDVLKRISIIDQEILTLIKEDV